MKHKLLQFSKLIAVVAFLVVFFGLAVKNTPDSTAIKATDFKAGRIIDDGVFYNSGSMSVADIQNFMDSHLPACDMWGTQKIGYGYYIKGKAVDPNITRAEYARKMRTEGGDSRYHDAPYVCINKYYENPTTHKNNFATRGVAEEGMLSAAQIIYDAAKEFNINPQVLLVMLKKESYAWGDDWPTKNEFDTIMGYACPDNAACDTKYYGFYNQVTRAAWQLNYYKEHIYSYNYHPFTTNKIYYSPTYSCGQKSVYIENYATASLYIYTPYTPNDAALRNYPGTATCGSYGNRNFFMYFSEWFGNPLLPSEYEKIEEAYELLGGEEKFGAKVGAVSTNKNTGIYWQQYENGYVLGNTKYGFYESSGPIREVWKSFGFEGGKLGFPVDNIKTNEETGIIFQQYQNGYIVGSDKTGYYESMGGIRDYWCKNGFEGGKMGFPVGNIRTDKATGGEYQAYENGIVIGSAKTGYYVISEEYLQKWLKNPSEYGLPSEDETDKQLTLQAALFTSDGFIISGDIYKKWLSLDLGKPIDILRSNKNTGIYWQEYEKGYVLGNAKYGFYESSGPIRQVWRSFGFEGGKLGFPVDDIRTNEKSGIVFQQYQKGYIVGKDDLGYYESTGKIRDYWHRFNFENGKMGFPISNIGTNTKTGIYFQEYENGFILGNDKYGYHESTGKIREVWRSFGFEGGKFGFPVDDIRTNTATNMTWQQYQNGYIVGNDKVGFYESTGALREYWRKSGYESGKMGFPTSNVRTSGNYQYQQYQNGVLYYNTKTKKYTW